MGQFLGFGSGTDGDLLISSNTTEAPIDSSAVTSGANLTATNVSFAANQMILVHQSQGTGVGGWEVNQIKTYVAGTITPQVTLANTYNSGAQVRVLPQYKSVTVNSSITWTAKAWNGTVGGIIGYICSGSSNVVGNISANSTGFRGGAGVGSSTNGIQGEGETGVGGTNTAANGVGGGGGQTGNAAGGGGGNGQAGITGGKQGGTGGVGGGINGTSDLTTMIFGGGGGSGCNNQPGGGSSGAGGIGGGIVFIMSSNLSTTGSITATGGVGGNVSGGDGTAGGGGAGAGGSILIKTITSTIGSNLITALGNTGGVTGNGGAGGVGRIRLEACVITDSSNDSNPVSSRTVGGLSWCFAGNSML